MAKSRSARRSFILQFTYTSPLQAAQPIIFTPITRNKHRLYLAIYARPKNPNLYHYAIHLSPKQSLGPTIKFHSKNVLQALSGSVSIPWVYERVAIDPNLDLRLLARVRLGKVTVSPTKFESCMKEVSINSDGTQAYNCAEWVRRALVIIANEHLLEEESVKWLHENNGWTGLKSRADDFVEQKKVQGRFSNSYLGSSEKAPSLDLVSMKEFVPGILKSPKAKSI